MRIAFGLYILSLSLVTFATTSAQNLGPQWMTDLASAKAAAQQSGKLVLVHFWMPNCPPCVALERDVFSQPQVTKIMQERFVLVKINAIDSRPTADALGVTNVPADVILTPQGEVIDRSISPNSPTAYMAHVSNIASRHQTGRRSAFDAAAANAPVQVPNAAYGSLNIPSTGIEDRTVATEQLASSQNSGAPTSIANPYTASPPLANATSPVTPELESTVTGPAHASRDSRNPAMGDRYAMNNSVAAAATDNPYARVGASQPNNPSFDVKSNPTTTTMPGSVGDSGLAASSGNPSGLGQIPTASTASQGQTPQMSTVATLPPGSPPLGFDGYCPVSIMRQVTQLPEAQWKMIPGDKRYGLEHRGKVYLFATEECRQAFYENPDHYSPALAGLDPVLFLERSQSTPGTINHGVEYNGQIYLFSSEHTLNRFRQHAEQYATGVRQAMQPAPSRMIR